MVLFLRFALALLTPLAVEAFTRLWPRVYDCGKEYASRRRARYWVILPLVSAAAFLVGPDLRSVLFVLAIGLVAALDLAYHRISLPLQAGLLVAGLLVAQGEPQHLLAGVLLGVGYLVVAILLSFWLGPMRSPGFGDAVVLAAVGLVMGAQTWLILLLAVALIIGAQAARFIQSRQIIPVGFFLGLALLIGFSWFGH